MGCPAMWTGPQRRRLLDLARKAGIPVGHATLVDEPVAAGVAWLTHRYLAHREAPEGRVLVFDMGGGTLDVAVLDVVGGAKPDVTVLAAIGLPEAGDDLDRAHRCATSRPTCASRGFDVAASPTRRSCAASCCATPGRRRSRCRRSTVAHDPARRRATSVASPPSTYTRDQLEEAFAAQLDRASQMVWAALRAARLTAGVGAGARRSCRARRHRRAAPARPGRAGRRRAVRGAGRRHEPDPGRRPAAGRDAAQGRAARAGRRLPRRRGRGGRAGRHRRLRPDQPAPARRSTSCSSGTTAASSGCSTRRTPRCTTRCRWPGATRFLGHSWHGRYPEVAREGEGVLRVLSPTGDPVRLEIDGEPMDGIPVGFGSHAFSFKIYCGGQILISDGAGREFGVRVDAWPVVRGADYDVKLELSTRRGGGPRGRLVPPRPGLTRSRRSRWSRGVQSGHRAGPQCRPRSTPDGGSVAPCGPVPAVGLPVRPGRRRRAVPALDVAQAPADLGRRVGPPVAAGGRPSCCPAAPAGCRRRRRSWPRVVLQPLSCCHSGSSADIWLVAKPNDGSRLQATSRFPEYAEQPDAGTTGAWRRWSSVVAFGRRLRGLGRRWARPGPRVVGAGALLAGGRRWSGTSSRDARSSVRRAASSVVRRRLAGESQCVPPPTQHRRAERRATARPVWSSSGAVTGGTVRSRG